MPRVKHELLIHATPDRVYEVSQNYALRYEWDTFPDSIELLDGAQLIQTGVRVKVIAKNGLMMVIKFVSVSPPTTTAIKMESGPIWLNRFAGSWIFKPTNDGATLATFTYQIQCKWWAMPLISDRIALWYFKQVIVQRLQGLKDYCETSRE